MGIFNQKKKIHDTSLDNESGAGHISSEEMPKEQTAVETGAGDVEAGREAEGARKAGQEAEGAGKAGREAEGVGTVGRETEGAGTAGREAEGVGTAGRETEGAGTADHDTAGVEKAGQDQPAEKTADSSAPESPLMDFTPVGFQDTQEQRGLPENLVSGRAYIFSALSSLEEIMGILCTAFGVSPKGQKDTLELHNGDVAIHVSVACESEGEGAKKFISEQVQGTWGHFYPVKTGAVDVKTNLLYQIGWSKAFLLVEYAFIPDEDLDRKVDIEDMFIQTLDNLEAVMLIQDEEDQIFCQGEYGERLLVLSDTGGSAFRRYLPYQAAVLKAGGSISQEQYDRRMRSRNVLEEQCIYVPAGYPVIERAKDISCPSPEDIAKRAVALLGVAVYSEFLLSEEDSQEKAMEFVEDIINRYDARDFFSPKEWAYLTNPDSTKQEKMSFTWQYENLLVMEWALGLVGKLDFPDHICDVAQAVGLIRDCGSVEEIVRKSKPRTPKELLDASDLIFCLDWACVNARINKLPAPASMKGGVVAERHKSLNWLTGYGDSAPWDEVRTDT